MDVDELEDKKHQWREEYPSQAITPALSPTHPNFRTTFRLALQLTFTTLSHVLNHPWRKSNAFARPSLKTLHHRSATLLCNDRQRTHPYWASLDTRGPLGRPCALLQHECPDGHCERGSLSAMLAKGLTAPIPITDTLTARLPLAPRTPRARARVLCVRRTFSLVRPHCHTTMPSTIRSRRRTPLTSLTLIRTPPRQKTPFDTLPHASLAATPKAAPRTTPRTLAKAFYLRGHLVTRAAASREHVTAQPARRLQRLRVRRTRRLTEA